MIKKDKDIGSLFDERDNEKLDLISESIDDIKVSIKDRRSLHKDIIKNLEKLDLFIDNTMPKIEDISMHTSTVKSDIIRELLKKKIDIEELKIKENLDLWRDISSLKKELRDNRKEYREIRSKNNLIKGLTYT